MADFMDVSDAESADNILGQQDLQQNHDEQTGTQFKMRYIRLKDVGTRLSADKRWEIIVEKAKPLPNGSQLNSRSVYWFVTMEEVSVNFSGQNVFALREHLSFECNGQKYYLTQIDFQKNKEGTVQFVFNDGIVVWVGCCKSKTSTKRKNIQDKFDSESQELINTAMFTNGNNTNQIQQDNTDYNNNAVQYNPAVYPVLIVNFLLLVPDESNLITKVKDALQEIGFEKEVSSLINQQHLYSQKKSDTKIQHVLLVPYAKLARYIQIEEYLKYASEAILLIENPDQEDNLMAISTVQNSKLDNSWDFVVKSSIITDFGKIRLDYQILNKSAQRLLSIAQLRQTVVGGASMKYEPDTLLLADFFLRWTIGDIHGPVMQNIYVCFRYEPKTIKTFTEYAAISLAVLNIEYEAVGAHGSVLVYIQCPGYIPWYIMLHKEEIFNKLAGEGLTEIYECFISDIEESMQRPDNEEFMDELMYLKEQMISDGIQQEKTTRFRVKLVEEQGLKIITGQHLALQECFDIKRKMESNNNARIFLEEEDIAMIAETVKHHDLFAICTLLVEDCSGLNSLPTNASDFAKLNLMLQELHRQGLRVGVFIDALSQNESSLDLVEKLKAKYGANSNAALSDENSEAPSEPMEIDSNSSVKEWEMEALALLRKGLKNNSVKFTPQQQKVLQSLLSSRKNTLFITSTGGGKSATYFVTTFLLRKQDPKAGPTIVVSPFLALMADQVKNAQKFGLNAATYNSSMSELQKSRVIKSLSKNEIDIIFSSAEMLTGNNFPPKVPQLLPNYSEKRGGSWTHVPLLVIDEVHCISEWGHDFRPSYFTGLQTIMKQRWAKDTLIIGTSATVPKHTQADIQKVFEDHNWNIVRGSLYRKNLAIRVIYEGTSLTEKMNWIEELINDNKGKNILIFSDSKTNVQAIAGRVNASYYHAELKPDTRKKIEDDFRDGKIKVLVSTNALSMGFDKSDIHIVVHTYTPASAVQYYQEIGRAGRGIKSATAYLLYSKPWRRDIKRDIALRRIFTIMEQCINQPCNIEEVIENVADDNVPRSDAEEAITLGVSRGYLKKIGATDIILPNKISFEQMKEHQSYTQTRLAELNFMKDLLQVTETKCIWVNLLHFLGQATPEDFRCEKCSRCDIDTQDIPMLPISENWKMLTPSGITVYGLSYCQTDQVDFDSICDLETIRDILLNQEQDLAADPPAWAMTYIPGSENNNKNSKDIADDLGLEVFEFVTTNPEAGSMKNSHTDQVIENKFFLDETKLPPPGCSVLVYNDSAKSDMTIDKIASFLRMNDPKRRIIALVTTIWACKGRAPPTKLNQQ